MSHRVFTSHVVKNFDLCVQDFSPQRRGVRKGTIFLFSAERAENKKTGLSFEKSLMLLAMGISFQACHCGEPRGRSGAGAGFQDVDSLAGFRLSPE